MKYPLCIVSYKRGHDKRQARTIQFCIEAKQQAYIFIYEKDYDNYKDLEQYNFLKFIIIPEKEIPIIEKSIAKKRHYMIDYMSKIVSWIWVIDDDYIRFTSYKFDNVIKKKILTITELFETAEQYIDLQRDTYCKIPPAGSFQTANAKSGIEYTITKKSTTGVAGCYGLNLNIMKKYKINFNTACPGGLGEDTELMCQFIKYGLNGITCKTLEAQFNDKDSIVWNTDRNEQFKKVYRFLYDLYPELIDWNPDYPKNTEGSAIINKSKESKSPPNWYIQEGHTKQFTFGGTHV